MKFFKLNIMAKKKSEEIVDETTQEVATEKTTQEVVVENAVEEKKEEKWEGHTTRAFRSLLKK